MKFYSHLFSTKIARTSPQPPPLQGRSKATTIEVMTKVSEGNMLLENSPNLKGVRILVVDDDRDTLELLEFLFEHYGAQVRTAATASEVLEVLTQWQPEILLSDIAMPSLDGYTLIRMLRAMPSEFGGQIPAIALTAYAVETDHQQMLLKAGFQKHIAKPVDLTELATVIANVVRQNIGHKNSELS